jgi:hypothetical protein
MLLLPYLFLTFFSHAASALNLHRASLD